MALPNWYIADCQCPLCETYHWVPPTDEERKMFIDAADVQRNQWYVCDDFCVWSDEYEAYISKEETAQVAESLAMDGL